MNIQCAYGSTLDPNSYAYANFLSIENVDTGVIKVQFTDVFDYAPTVIATPFIPNPQSAQARVDRIRTDDRTNEVVINTFVMDGDNFELNTTGFCFVAITNDLFEDENTSVLIATVDGTGSSKSLRTNSGFAENGLTFLGTGEYQLTFETPFETPPVAVATICRFDDNENSASKFRAVIITEITTTYVKVMTLDDTDGNNEWFNILVVGPATAVPISTYKMANGRFNRNGSFEENEVVNIDVCDRSDNATYEVQWHIEFDPPPVTLVCVSHDDQQSVRQAQVEKNPDGDDVDFQIAEPPGFNDSNFHLLAVAFDG